jgi:ribonuclease P protein component
VTITYVDGEGATRARVAYAVSRGVGGAVERNRLRRRLRAVVRELGTELDPGAYLVGAGPEAVTLAFDELRDLVHEAIEATRPVEP